MTSAYITERLEASVKRQQQLKKRRNSCLDSRVKAVNKKDGKDSYVKYKRYEYIKKQFTGFYN